MTDTDRADFKRLDSLVALALAGGGGVIPVGLETVIAHAFTFATPSPILLGACPAGAIINRAVLLITTPFSDPAASATFGLVLGSASAFLAAGDSQLSAAAQYEKDDLVTVAVADTFKLTLSPAASVAGAGVLLFKFLA
jgi:hypothetical protein